MSEQLSTAQCPSCGRFVGPYEKCPYCGADVGQRMSLRAFKYGSLALAVVGLIVLLVIARRSQPPTVEIGSLAGTMNWAYVRLEGTAVRQPTYDPQAESLKFWLWDGTGEIMVTAYRSEAEALLAEDRVPVMGDQAAVEGTLRIKEDFAYLILNAPQNLQVQPGEAVEMTIAQAQAAPLYQKVTVRGVVRADRSPYAGLRILTLRDETGEIDVTLPTSDTVLGGDLPPLRVGQAVRATGAVDQYKGTPQVSVGRGRDVALLDEEIVIAPARSIGEISAADVGRMVQVEGQIVEVSPFSAGVKFSLDDGTGTVTLLLWQDLYEALSARSAFDEGATVRALGEVSEYRGGLEIVPELPADVTLLAAAERTVTGRQLGELSAADVGRTVQVEGVLQSLRTFSAGVKGVLDDGTGQVTLLLWQDVYDGLDEPEALTPGAVLRVVGEVSEYRGELEIAPQVAADVAVVGRVELPVEEVAIGQLRSDDVGRTVQVAGKITSVELFSKGVKYTLDDGTGSLTLLVWQDLYDQDDRFSTLAEGFGVRVRGEIAEYQGDLEIIPQVPADVEITHGGPVAQVTMTNEPMTNDQMTPTPQFTNLPTPNLPIPTPTPTATPQPTNLPTPQPTNLPTPNLPTPTPAAETRTIGQISSADIGSTFTLAQAGIAEVHYFSKGVKYTLTDSSGSITLLLWQNVVEEIADRYDLFPGSQVRVTGEIDEYQGDLEIVPQNGADVAVIHRGDRPPVEARSIGQITASDEGRVFIVEGTVARTESNQWLKLWLRDGTGEILVYAPQRVVEYLPAGIGAGVRLRVTGEVDIYKGVIEIIPRAGEDVETR